MKLTAEQKLKRALATLDKAVQAYYAEYDPENKERYASVHIRNYPEDDAHASRVTLQIKGEYIDVESKLQRGI